MSFYRNIPHIGCGGVLTFEKEVVENVTVNARAVKKFNARPIIKQLTKSMHRCDKCHDLVNVISCPSWEDFVLRGKIRVSKEVYWKLKNDRKRGAVRL